MESTFGPDRELRELDHVAELFSRLSSMPAAGSAHPHLTGGPVFDVALRGAAAVDHRLGRVRGPECALALALEPSRITVSVSSMPSRRRRAAGVHAI